MEKKTPHYKLARAQALVMQGAYRATMSARTGAAAPSTAVGPVYLKLTVIDDVLIVSFKER